MTGDGPIPQPSAPVAASPGPMSELVLYFLRLGLLGFGGPVALVGQMERELVDERGWLSKAEMREAIAVSQSLPGPLPVSPTRAFDLPLSLSMVEETRFRAELVADWTRRGEGDVVADVGDTILKGPELLLDSIFTCTSSLGSRRPVRLWEDDDQRSMMSQILDVQMGPRKQRIWSEFMSQWTQREARYLGDFGNSRANTAGFEDGRSDADLRQLAIDQRKVFWDALRRTYLARYKVPSEEKIREEAWYLDRWSGADFVLLPPMLAGYVFYRGLDRRFSVLGTYVSLSIEPVSEWYRGNKRDLPAMVAVDWSMKHWPIGVIVSAGLHDGRYGLDFVGIGTSMGAVRRALTMQEERR